MRSNESAEGTEHDLDDVPPVMLIALLKMAGAATIRTVKQAQEEADA